MVTLTFAVSSVAADSLSEPGSTPPRPDSESNPTASISDSGALAAAEPAEAPSDSGAAGGQTAGSSAERTALNLLGQVDSSSGESRRNENVDITLIDNNVLKELNIRMGTTATIVRSFDADKGYFGAEFGGAPAAQIHLPAAQASRFHGNFYESHNNSVFSARSFFQVGGVKPARTNDYGFRLGAPLWSGGHFTVDGNQQRIRGNVNGNVLVPGPGERTPLATDPQLREFVSKILDSFPDELPNRTDINARALNTNAPQEIDNDSIGARFDQAAGESDAFFSTTGSRPKR